MMRVLITGGTGFLGSAVRRFLAGRRGLRIFTLGRSRAPGRHLRADLADPAAARRALAACRPDLVIHAAGGNTTMDWPALWRANVEATRGLLDAVLALPGRRPRVVVAGSAHEYGPSSRPWREGDLPSPRTPYGWSKLCQTRAALAYAGLGAKVVVARVFNLIGPGLPPHHALAAFARQAVRAERGRLGAIACAGPLTSRRDFLDAADAASALWLLARRGRSGEVYNVCSGRGATIRRLLARLVRASGARPGVRGGAGPGDTVLGSNARLRALGWRPASDLDGSLSRLLEEWRTRS